MFDQFKSQLPDMDIDETGEWLESLEALVETDGGDRARYVLRALIKRARELNVGLPALMQSPYINTIPPNDEPSFPGDEAMEKRIRRMVRWNAMAMVHRANMRFDGLGGHLSTYASGASLYETGFNHFFRGPDAPGGGDQVFFQGHAAPGIYARAFLEGRLSQENLDHFRRETTGKGLSSYPHPWLMPDFWQFPTVSMGLSPIAAIYQARFNRYLHNRGIKDTSNSRVWAFLGDGECDEPESLGALSVAAREGLDNLVFVVNCNLQRLDGPVRGNGKIIQELEAVFRGAGWHVLKVVWGPDWDPILEKDVDGALVNRMNTVVDGQFQKYSVSDGAYIRDHFFGADPKLLKLVENISDADLEGLRRGGHSYTKVYSAYQAATQHQNAPVVILAKTVKGWALGDVFEASNVTHSMKKLSVEQLTSLRDRLHLPISDQELPEAPYYHPGEDSPEVKYIQERREALGGALPSRRKRLSVQVPAPKDDVFQDLFLGAKGNLPVSSTMGFVRFLRKLMRDKEVGKYVVPIVPDECRTFGMESFFRDFGIYAALGQKYEPVDAEHFLYYRESLTGQILEEGLTEAGSMASLQAAGTSYATHGIPMIPFYMTYSMFGMQRTGDSIWSFADVRGRGFLLGATAGRTTLNGEGLQHQDGHSQLFAFAFPKVRAYDPAYAYEIAVIIRDGLRRMLENDEDCLYYLTLYNENYMMPPLPEGVEEGILKGLYRLPSDGKAPKKPVAHAQLFGSGSILHQCVLDARKILIEDFDVAAEVWSVTSYQQLFRDARECERKNRFVPVSREKKSYLKKTLQGVKGPIIAVSDWVQEIPAMLVGFVEQTLVPLGTNGLGRSDTREALRRHFEIDAGAIVIATLSQLAKEGSIDWKVVKGAMKRFDWSEDKADPFGL